MNKIDKVDKVDKVYQVYTVTNTLTNKVYIAHTFTKVNPKTKYFSTNKALYDDLNNYDFSFFLRKMSFILLIHRMT